MMSTTICSTTAASTTVVPPDLTAFLSALKLDAYGVALVGEGWDDLNFLTSLSKEELHKIAQSAKMKPGHAAKFVWALKQGPGASVATPPTPPTAAVAAADADDAVIAVIVDRSGSMSSMGAEVMNGFNTFLAEQQKLPGECTATIIRFDNTVEVIHRAVPLADVPKADAQTFKPRGMTALYDAIGTGIAELEAQIKAMAKPPSRVMMMILTDGAENTSQKYNQKTVSANIKRLTKDNDWKFVFIGANQDAIHTGSQMGVAAADCLTFGADKMYQTATWEAVSTNCTNYRGHAKESGFSASQRNAACPFMHPRLKPSTDFFAGQKVQARFSISSRWKNAVVRRIRGTTVTVQFEGFGDIVDVPANRVRDTGTT